MKTWKVIPGTEGLYEVSTCGAVRRNNKVLKQGYNHKGYPRVYLSIRNKQTTVLVHKLVLLAFVGPAPDGHETLHKNNIKTDNRLCNLRWGTRSENIQQTYDEGRKSWFEQHPRLAAKVRGKNPARGEKRATRLSDEKVMLARKLRREGLSYKKISAQLGAPFITVYNAILGRNWAHLPGALPKIYGTEDKRASRSS